MVRTNTVTICKYWYSNMQGCRHKSDVMWQCYTIVGLVNMAPWSLHLICSKDTDFILHPIQGILPYNS